jgi:hypothetical protein
MYARATSYSRGYISNYGHTTGHPDVFVVFLSPPSTHGYYFPHNFQITAHWPPAIRLYNIMNKEIKEMKTNPAVLESAM